MRSASAIRSRAVAAAVSSINGVRQTNIDMLYGGPGFTALPCPAKVKTRANWYNPCAFIDPLSGEHGTNERGKGSGTPQNGPGIPWGSRVLREWAATESSGNGRPTAISYLGGKQNQIYGPGYERVNMSLFKNFHTWRAQYFQFRADAFNLLNHPTWGQVATQPGWYRRSDHRYSVLPEQHPGCPVLPTAGKYVF
jgi:hypothetical protein